MVNDDVKAGAAPLVTDSDFEWVKREGKRIEARQHGRLVRRFGRMTGYSVDHISIEGNKMLRSANEFFVEADQA